jgi:anhydro-N-acetylmuramic acid kinase
MHAPQSGDGRRWTAGVSISARCRRVTAALVGVAGRGLDAHYEFAGAAAADIPAETVARLCPVIGSSSCPADALAVLRAELADVQAAALQSLLAELSVADGRVLAVGVDDPGFWRFDRAVPIAYLGLCDSARLAEATGLNVIDAFPARDVAQGGQGGPIHGMAHWVLLRDPRRGRVLLDLGQTARMTCLPALAEKNKNARVLSFDVGPGMAMLDRLAERLSGGRHRFDPGGRLAVQGRRIPELIEHWLGDPYFDRPLPRWHPWGVRPERFLTDGLQKAVKADWSVRDLLCSATHFIAEAILEALTRRLPEDARIDELVVTGGGQHNGMLLAEIAPRVGAPLVPIGDLGIPGEALEAASAAVLAMLHLDQTPANATAITGTNVPRVLGRLTPGSPQSWRRLLQSSVESPAVRPLRSAL